MLFRIIWGLLLVNGIWWIVSLLMGWQNKFWSKYFSILGKILGCCIVVGGIIFLLAPLIIGVYLAVTTDRWHYLHFGWGTAALFFLAVYKKNIIRTTTYTIFREGKEVEKYKISERI